MAIKEESIQSLKDAINVIEVIGDHVVLKKQGNVRRGLCPFHLEV